MKWGEIFLKGEGIETGVGKNGEGIKKGVKMCRMHIGSPHEECEYRYCKNAIIKINFKKLQTP